MTATYHSLLVGSLGLALCLSTHATAQDISEEPPASPGDHIDIGSEVGGFEGVRQLNIAAGDGNQQANVASVASGDFAVNTVIVSQFTDQPEPDEARTYSARISGDAFAGSHGLTAINVASGSGNQQANLTLITTGLEGQIASTSLLSQSRASSEPHGVSEPSDASEHIAQIDSTAFGNSSGIVQVNLIGGTGNTSANVAVLSIQASTN